MEPEKYILIGILCMTWLESAWSQYLRLRQRSLLKATTKVTGELEEIITLDTLIKARNYQLDSLTFAIFHTVIENIIGTLILVLYMLPFIWNQSSLISDKIGFADKEIVISIIFMLIFNTISTTLALPFSLYSTFVIEERHGFNKQTYGFFFKDLIKGYVLMQLMVVIVVAPIVYIIKAGGQFFFLYLWVFVVLLSLLLMTIYPDFIAPLFDKYTPLEEGELKTQIEQLAARVDFPLTKIYIVEGSKRSSHSNAYFYGFYKNKRIVLFDTLLQDRPSSDKEKNDVTKSVNESNVTTTTTPVPAAVEEKKGCSNEEILAVLAHELGHWKKNHTLKQLIITQVNLLILFLAFSFLFKYQILYRAFGFMESMPVIIGLTIILQFVFSPYHFVFSFFSTMLSRRHEFEADAFAKSLGKAEFLRRSLIKLNKDNLGFPIYDWLYSLFNHSHPPILERLSALGKTE